jgi:hypothetical protein
MKKHRVSGSASDKEKPAKEKTQEVVDVQPTAEEAPKETPAEPEDTDGDVEKSGADDGDDQVTADAVTEVDEDEDEEEVVEGQYC